MNNKMFTGMKCNELQFDYGFESFESVDERLQEESRNEKKKDRPCAWIRENKHKKHQERKYHFQHHPEEYSGEKGVRLQSAIYFNGSEADWRGNGYVNFHQCLYRSARGDIRVYHGTITAYPRVYAPVPTRARKRWMALANRRIRHMKNTEDKCLPYSYLKKQFTHLDDGL